MKYPALLNDKIEIRSPSAGRAWIEIGKSLIPYSSPSASPSAGRAWIEILRRKDFPTAYHVALRGEGVD